ncbi:alpha-L-fucosidase [uncultured Maribacter sp.]|uniref:alpha-L-fucosidase n=1 Tax=uncultured Maribacter sp. TaxID=431308 RepID=UPI0026339BAA|nr:alpha-L-fucosidase [uncultured Maribacter sp.]
MQKINRILFQVTVVLFSMLFITCKDAKKETTSVANDEVKKTNTVINKSPQQLKEEFIDKRFGMFICYNIMSYGAEWGEANYPIESFNPQKLDCNQWAEAAVSAGMKFGLLTTKHHEGFALWDTKYSDYDVASTPYKKDIVRQYVDAFRAKGLGVGLYYSIWDSTNDVEKDRIDEEKLGFIKGQITELLTNYGKVDYFVMDGWFWRMGHKEVPYHEIRALIRELQPDCLITDHTHLQAPYHMDIPYFEGPFGAYPAEGNTMASALGHCSVKGNGWFWNEKTPNGLIKGDGVETILKKLNDCEDRYCNFMLNCMPNRDGLLDPIYINMLAEIGSKWKPNLSRASLPNQGPQIITTAPIQSVSASSGKSENLYDAKQVKTDHFHWESDTNFPQNIVIDLGEVVSDIDVLTVVPNHRCKPAPETALAEGNITFAKVYGSKDNKSYQELATQKWEVNSKYRTIAFPKSDVRYLKLEILEANGDKAIVAELEVGKSLMD